MRAIIALLLFSCCSLSLLAADEAKQETVAPRPFRVDVTVDGVVETTEVQEIVLRPEEWATFKVQKAIPHGTRVQAGDELVSFETKQIDRELRDLEFQLNLGDLGLQQAEVELAALEKTTPIDLAAAERAHQQALDDWKFFLEKEAQLDKQQVVERTKQMQDFLDMEREELDQLQKMYAADELTEETEEIILKRQKRAVESAEFNVMLTEVFNQRQIDVFLPRQKTTREENVKREGLNLDRAKVALAAGLKQKRIDVEKLRVAQTQLQEKAANTKRDRELMVIKAPVGGYVYYGASDRGKWTGIDTLRGLLKTGGSAAPETVLMTIIKEGGRFVRVDVAEKDLLAFQPEAIADVATTVNPDSKFAGKVTSVDPVPVKDGVFDGRITVNGDGFNKLLPGTTVKVTIATVEQAQAITLPTSAIFSRDEVRDGRVQTVRHVFLQKDGQPVRTDVQTGPASGDRTLIRDGVQAGDQVLLTKPEGE